MDLARQLEKRLERLVDGASRTIFRGRVHPVDLATRLIREADLNLAEGPAGPVVPNEFHVTLSPVDLEAAGSAARLGSELAHTLQATAAERGWRLEGPAAVAVAPNPAVRVRDMRISSEVAPGEHAPWGQLIGTRKHADLGPNRVLLGRATDCDIILSEPEVSRHHAIIHREQQRSWITDLGSANGTTVDGSAVTTPVPLRPGARLAMGPATFMFRLVEP
jgi:hypothetical protein